MACSVAEAPPVLDRSAFTQQLTLSALRIPKQRCNELMKRFTGFTFDRPKTRCIVPDGEGQDTRLLLLNETVTSPQGLTEPLQALLASEQLEWTQHEVVLGYGHLSAEQVLKALLPAGMEIPTSFEAVGHIAHLNLREEALSFKALIGQVLLDKNPSIRTVVNKVGSIDNEFRVFQMELLAGEPRLETEVKQHAARFRLDFSQVYWNSRLETEHTRLVGLFKRGEVVVDVMAGIGPFAIPAALAGCMVYANDLNPASARYLAANVRLNRVGAKVAPFNMDGRDFVRLVCATRGGPVERLREQQQQQQQQPQQPQQPPQQRQGGRSCEGAAEADVVPPPWPAAIVVPPGGIFFHHAVMNLPASAVEFLDAFRGAFCPATWRGRLPLVHCYTFSKGESEQDVIARVEAVLGGKLDQAPTIHQVRDVAPNKLMLCVSFRVPESVAFAGPDDTGSAKQQSEHPPTQQRQQQQQWQQSIQMPEQQAQQQRLQPAEAGDATSSPTAGDPALKKQRTSVAGDSV